MKKEVTGTLADVMKELQKVIGKRFFLQMTNSFGWGFHYHIVTNGITIGHVHQGELVSANIYQTEIELSTRLVYAATGIKLENPTFIYLAPMPEMKKPWGFYGSDKFCTVNVSNWRNTSISPIDKFNGTGIHPASVLDVFVGFAEQFDLTASDIGSSIFASTLKETRREVVIAEGCFETEKYVYVLEAYRYKNGEFDGRYFTFEKFPCTPIIVERRCDGFYKPCGCTYFTHYVTPEYRNSYVCECCGIESYHNSHEGGMY